MPAGPYCVIADLYSKADTAFVLECADDDNSGTLDATELGYVTDRINEASDYIFAKLGFLYSDAALQASSYIKRACTVMACYLLSKRRANPPKFKDEWDYWTAEPDGELNQISIGVKRIPDAQPLNTPVPSQSNLGYVGGQPNGRPMVVDTGTDPVSQQRQHPVNTDFAGGGWGGIF